MTAEHEGQEQREQDWQRESQTDQLRSEWLALNAFKEIATIATGGDPNATYRAVLARPGRLRRGVPALRVPM